MALSVTLLLLPLVLHAQESETAPVIPVYSFLLQSLNGPSGPALTAYVADVTKSVNRRWSARVREAVSYGKGVVAVRFTVNKNGTLAPDSIATEVSASPLLDQASTAIIASAPPFNTFPKELNLPGIEFRCTFRYGLLPDGPYKTLYESARTASGNRDYSTAAQIMETLLAKDPDFSNGWNFLGWLYNKQGRYKLAAIALLKAIEVNPFDPYAYNNLGQALAGQKKYEEAVTQYLKQIEINKGDVYAYGNLGRVYLELNQNQKAQDALEAVAALSAKPDPYVQFNLGRAYSRNNQPKKAVEAFQKSAEIEPIPNRYNSVAYELAINHLDLNIAEHYAESAIADTMLKSRMTSLDHLTAEDVRLSAALPSYWDTLG
ncbi:MAG TPA: tetratricopeptide repeat protein [Candidatus Acidoferrum sp.]